MADIRQNTNFLDDLYRPSEEPLSDGGNWTRTDAVWSQGLRLLFSVPFDEGTIVEPSAGSKFGASYWIPDAWDGDDAEAWGHATGGNYPGIHWQIGLVRDAGGANAVDGYAFRRTVTTGGGSLRLIRIVNGSYALNIDSFPGGPTSGQHMLIRRNGNDVEGWLSADTITWVLRVSATDTTYMTGLHLDLALSDNARQHAHGWQDIGGGPAPARRRMPQIYRIINAPRRRGTDT